MPGIAPPPLVQHVTPSYSPQVLFPFSLTCAADALRTSGSEMLPTRYSAPSSSPSMVGHPGCR